MGTSSMCVLHRDASRVKREVVHTRDPREYVFRIQEKQHEHSFLDSTKRVARYVDEQCRTVIFRDWENKITHSRYLTHPRPSETVRDRPGPSETVRGRPRPSETVRGYSKNRNNSNISSNFRAAGDNISKFLRNILNLA
jgi:hypothetical protein